MTTSFKELLFEKFLEWQRDEKEIKTQKEFANYIGIKEASLNHIMSGRRGPSRRIVEHLAEFYNDLRFYDSANLIRPDQQLKYIIENWPSIPLETRKKVTEEISRFSNEPAPNIE